MSKEFNLSIHLPTKTFLQKEVFGVVLPAVKADVSVLADRAPSVFVLDYGVLQILDKNGKVANKYFVHSGVADVALNDCKVMVQKVLDYDSITLAGAREMLDTLTDIDERLFYEMIIDTLKGNRKHYLRTLNVMKKVKERGGISRQRPARKENIPPVE